MKRVYCVALCVVALVAVLFSGETRTAEAVICDPRQLSHCTSALMSPVVAPSAACCSSHAFVCTLRTHIFDSISTLPTVEELLLSVMSHGLDVKIFLELLQGSKSIVQNKKWLNDSIGA
ncbi:hypothetical protein HRI_001131600 [Hibiscus trionum]|uniref:Bifunctional inhibitor/plant lipid transfer protein/seed storage helical domain-containing protein n=1 Tax=Hibiscus trionum TaxID=183268 RepID=A0A9W7HC76_HIBTR|nr:hypothetical protein HRI_001131600 [Hibiscus trionum]